MFGIVDMGYEPVIADAVTPQIGDGAF